MSLHYLSDLLSIKRPMLKWNLTNIPFIILEVFFNIELLILIFYLQINLTQLNMIVLSILYILILLRKSRDL